MRHIVVLILALFIAMSSSNAQNADKTNTGKQSRTLIGVVKDSQGKGLVVYLKSTPSKGTETDRFGNFELKGLPEGSLTVIVTMLGMEEVEILYTGQESTVVTLKEQAQSIDDVVVTGIVTRNRNSFTGSASTFSGSPILKLRTFW